jgi:hypothetical protein
MVIKRLGTGFVAKHRGTNSIGLGRTYREALGNLIANMQVKT